MRVGANICRLSLIFSKNISRNIFVIYFAIVLIFKTFNCCQPINDAVLDRVREDFLFKLLLFPDTFYFVYQSIDH